LPAIPLDARGRLTLSTSVCREVGIAAGAGVLHALDIRLVGD
jgi:hypothetical protein